MIKSKKEILKGFILGVFSTICFFLIIGDIQIETDFEFGNETKKTNNLSDKYENDSKK